MRMQMADPLSAQPMRKEPHIRPPQGGEESTEAVGVREGARSEEQVSNIKPKDKEEENEIATHLSNIAYEKMKDAERKS
jgi:hypothetical protein